MNLLSKNSQIPLSPVILDSMQSSFEDVDYLMSVCHEIRTPLNAIIGLSTILSKHDCNEAKRIQCAEVLCKSSHMLMELLNDLLDSSKINAGKMKIQSVQFDMTEVIKEACHIISVQAEEKGLILRINIHPHIPHLFMGDPLRICQILINLLSNAIKFTPAGYITIFMNTAFCSNGAYEVRLVIADDGIGMKPSEMEIVFDKYTQATVGTSQHYGGTGLGLSISQELAHLMNGKLTVESKPGQGSRFILTLPLKLPELQKQHMNLKPLFIEPRKPSGYIAGSKFL